MINTQAHLITTLETKTGDSKNSDFITFIQNFRAKHSSTITPEQDSEIKIYAQTLANELVTLRIEVEQGIEREEVEQQQRKIAAQNASPHNNPLNHITDISLLGLCQEAEQSASPSWEETLPTPSIYPLLQPPPTLQSQHPGRRVLQRQRRRKRRQRRKELYTNSEVNSSDYNVYLSQLPPNLKSNLQELGIAEYEIHNLTNDTLSDSEKQSLAYGINFIPTPRYNRNKIISAQTEFENITRLNWHFRDENDLSEISSFYIPTGWRIPQHLWDDRIEQPLRILRHHLRKLKGSKIVKNWSKQQHDNLMTLLNKPNRLVITADKNLGYVYCTTDWYIAKCLKHLNNTHAYENITHRVIINDDNGQKTIEMLHWAVIGLTNLYQESLTDEEYKYIIRKNETPYKFMRFYILAKVHKKWSNPDQVDGRPIVPSINWITHHMSEFVAHELNQYLSQAHTVLKDSTELIRLLKEKQLKNSIKRDNRNIYLVSADVEALYPSINRARALTTIREFLLEHGYQDEKRLDFILRAIKFIHDHCYIEFDKQIYKQVFGTAMGTPLAPPYSNIFLHQLEKNLVEIWVEAEIVLLYKRFIDDTFIIIEGSEITVKEFIAKLNNLDPDIRFTYEISQKSIAFLDINIHFAAHSGSFHTSVYQKQMNKYAYLPAKSFHTMAMKKGFIKGEAIRYARICSKELDFTEMLQLFTIRLLKRGYSLKFITNALKDVDWNYRDTYLVEKPKNRVIPYIFKVEYNPSFKQKELRGLLDDFQQKLRHSVKNMPHKLNGKITICYKLPSKLHSNILKARKAKGF